VRFLNDVQANAAVLHTHKRHKIQGMTQWALWAHHDFQDEMHNWKISSSTPNANARQSCRGNGDIFLGGPCALSSGTASVNISHIPEQHKLLKVTARVHFLDRWQGEALWLKVDGSTVWTQSHTHCDRVFSSMCRGIDVCGDVNYPDWLSFRVEAVVPHSKSTSVSLEFGSTLTNDPTSTACGPSYGIDDVMLHII